MGTLTTEALGIDPNQIESGSGVADQIPGPVYRKAYGVGEHYIGLLAGTGPEAHILKAAKVPTWQA
jgi:hypothetical protein